MNLQRDEETGEMVSKNELKKRLQKRARKAARALAHNASDSAETLAPVSSHSTTPALSSTHPTINTPELDPDAMFKQGFLAQVYKERMTADGEVRTRFPPEPNGGLHLGHAKAIAINFGFAKYYGGKVTLRFDDTNPTTEKEEHVSGIENIIRWLGFKPDAVTYASDNFLKLYNHAEDLIKLSKAYVCHCTKEEAKLQRGGENGKEGPRYRCVHAEQDVETNLSKFRAMRDGEYEPQAAFLRMKQDIENPNPKMWDLPAYRVLGNKPSHHRTGEEWRIYPTYDFAHCLCDSIEGITHSLCTTEFVRARESYEWLNKTLGVYEPMQREFGRLNISGTVLSKRFINKLEEAGHVRKGHDPRLYTLMALRRRGVPPGAILSFVNELGVTTAKTLIEVSRFDQSIRQYLAKSVPRLMLVLDPIPVVIGNVDKLEGQGLDIPFFPKNLDMGSHTLPLTKMVYIDRSDFREVDSPDYFRLAPGKVVGLLNIPHPIKATSYSRDPITGHVTEIRAVLVREGAKPKAYIHWVPEGSRRVEVRMHTALFKSKDPSALSEDLLMADVDPNSERIFPSALVESGFEEVRKRAPWPEAAGERGGEDPAPESVRFQGIRVAYFAMDSDSTEEHVVLNRIVSLKEDSGKDKIC